MLRTNLVRGLSSNDMRYHRLGKEHRVRPYKSLAHHACFWFIVEGAIHLLAAQLIQRKYNFSNNCRHEQDGNNGRNGGLCRETLLFNLGSPQ